DVERRRIDDVDRAVPRRVGVVLNRSAAGECRTTLEVVAIVDEINRRAAVGLQRSAVVDGGELNRSCSGPNQIRVRDGVTVADKRRAGARGFLDGAGIRDRRSGSIAVPAEAVIAIDGDDGAVFVREGATVALTDACVDRPRSEV